MHSLSHIWSIYIINNPRHLGLIIIYHQIIIKHMSLEHGVLLIN